MNAIPVPEFNTGLGMHYFPDDAHYRVEDAQAWLPELKALGASWITLVGSVERAIPESFLRALIDSDIEPIIHILAAPIGAVDEATLRPLYQSYAKWGVHYVVLFDQPNTRAAWRVDDWGRESLVNRFLDLALPSLQIARDVGLVPVFPPLAQGGDYWDTSFLDAALGILQKRGQASLLKEMAFGIYGFAFNRPPEWGAGGSARWTISQPYLTPPGSQDQRGFRAFEWYVEIINARLGQPRPMLMLAGGARVGDDLDPAYPVVDPIRHTSCNNYLAKAMLERTLPKYVVNVSFWLLAAEPGSAQATAWYRSDGTTLPIVAELKKQIGDAKQAVSNYEKRSPQPAPTQHANGKPIYHYLLLPTFEWGASDWHWSAVFDYVREFAPTCGFSVAEAQAAEFVTIVGNEQGISAAAEDALRAAGCKVERICGANGTETRRRLSEMARAGKRFGEV